MSKKQARLSKIARDLMAAEYARLAQSKVVLELPEDPDFFYPPVTWERQSLAQAAGC